LPVWQQLFDSLKTWNFMVVAVAEESRGAEHARPWIEQAKAEYWCLIDEDHRVDTTRTLAPEHQAARQDARTAYLNAVRDWVLTGRHALPTDAARSALPQITPAIARAQAHFRLGVWLRQHGNVAEGDAHLAEASRLHPDSWSIWRQTADLDEVGKASGEAFWRRVQALGERPYYPPPNLTG
jgi:hypothetical protein